MAAKKFIVELDAEERARLDALISKGKASAKAILKARILLKADVAEGGPGWLDAQIVEALDTNLTMVSRVREAFVSKGLDAVLMRKKRETPPIPAIFDGEAQAAHSGDLDRVFRRIAIRCRERVGRSVTAPSGGLADLSIRDSRQACLCPARHA